MCFVIYIESLIYLWTFKFAYLSQNFQKFNIRSAFLVKLNIKYELSEADVSSMLSYTGAHHIAKRKHLKLLN